MLDLGSTFNEVSLEARTVKSDGYLYHYSLERYDRLLSLEAQGGDVDLKLENMRAEFRHTTNRYSEKINFLFAPAPLDKIAGYYNGENPFWTSGAKLYEYRVRIKNLDDMPGTLSEELWHTALLNAVEWYDDKDRRAEWFSAIAILRKMQGSIITNNRDLVTQAERYAPLTASQYSLMQSNPEWDDVKLKYAATVPHVALAPPDGIIVYDIIREVTVR